MKHNDKKKGRVSKCADSGRTYCYLDLMRREDLGNYDFLFTRGVKKRDDIGKKTHFLPSFRHTRNVNVLQSYFPIPDSIRRGANNRKAIMEQLENELKAK